ncbi:ELWxxDGT repeat protein [Thalassoroseus pseudoceratinae]|uniref:ELWxxDGT repeat protein n=1 Tax=Thalassoroseus pseudoceratinae TaxID=2713176 RepID=UPI001420A796|nr:ELWxxDGT repeat protein [Thalassoroseus pseudoceratinae]
MTIQKFWSTVLSQIGNHGNSGRRRHSPLTRVIDVLEDRTLLSGVQPQLVKDINPGSDGSVNFGSELTNVNGTLFFTADDGTNGEELWMSDGTVAGTVLVKDINPGSGSSVNLISELTNVGGTLFFRADDGINGRELWMSDGTAAGTVMVKDINPGGNSSWPNNLTNVDGTLFFTAVDGTNGEELWMSDGTAAGTVMVKDINPGTGHSVDFNSELINVDGTLFFTADDGTNGEELWMSNGTAASTVLVQDIRPGGGSSEPTNLTNVDGTLFFSANDGANGRALWQSDGTGTAAGTMLVKDIQPGTDNAFIFGELTNVDGTLFFRADDDTNGRELWMSDGTAAGTVLVKDINPGSESSFPDDFINVDGTLFFAANDGTNGDELWMSDGTAAGTVLVKDINPGAGGSVQSDPQLTNVGGTVFFAAIDGTNGEELWMSDGTAAGTVLVQDILPGFLGSEPDVLTNVDGTLFFVAKNFSDGLELHRLTETADLSIDDVTQDEDAGAMTFTVTLDCPLSTDVTVDYATALDSAEADDFTAVMDSVTIPAGETSMTFTVDVTADGTVEADEQFFVNLSNPQGGGASVTIADDQGVGTILNDDAATLSIDDVTQDEDAGAMTFTVSLDAAVDEDVSVDVATAPDSAEADDFIAVMDSITIPAGETSMTFTVDVTADGTVEADEQFFVNLSNPQGGGASVTIADDQGVGTILNDDAATLSIDDVTQDEDAGAMTFTVSLDAAVDEDVSVDVATAPDSAEADDFIAVMDSITIPAGETSMTFTVDVTADGTVEADEQFFVNLSNPQGGGASVTIADDQGVGTILNDDTATLSIGDVTQDEDAGAMTFTVSLDAAVDEDVSVDVATAPDSAKADDFTAVMNSITIPAGETSVTFNVDVTADGTVEADEQFFVNLSNPQGGGANVTIADNQGVGTILNDDTAMLSIGDVTQDEDAGAMTFTVSLNAAVDEDVSVDVATAPDSAEADDFTAVMDSVTIPAGETSMTFTVEVTADGTVEADEQFFVNLSNPQGGGASVTIADNQGVGTILNDDSTTPPPQLIDQPLNQTAINGSFRHVVSGNFDSVPAEAGIADDLFFWDPVAGINRFVFGDGSMSTNTVPLPLLNGNDFTQVLAGYFDGGNGTDLFFWNPRTGRNRLVHGEGGVETNVIDPPAINGNDFSTMVAANLDNNGPEDLFFWDPRSGRNRIVHYTAANLGSDTGVGAIQTNVVPTTALNGNSYQSVHVGEFIAGGSQLPELMFISLATGANRIVELSSNAGLQTGFSNFRNNVLPPSAFNGSDFSQIAIGNVNQDGLDDVFAWAAGRGRNRVALTNPNPSSLSTVETNPVNPGAINGEYDHVVRLTDQVFSNSLTDSFFFWDEITGRNRRASA